MMRRVAGAILFLALTVLGTGVEAQRADPCPADTASATARDPDLVVRARVEADQLRFESQPEVDVELTGCAVLDSVRVTERTNLPEPVEPGATYRDVAVGVEITGHLNVQCLLEGLVGADSAAVAASGLLESLCARPAQPDPAPRP